MAYGDLTDEYGRPMDDSRYPNAPGSFWDGGTPNLQVNTAPSIDFQGQTLPATATPGVYGTPAHAPTAAASGNAALWEQTGRSPQAFVQALIARDKLVGAQTDPTSINKILAALKEVGVNASLDTRTDQYHKGIMLNGQFVKLLDGSNNWIWGAGGDGAGGGAVDTSGLLNSSVLAPFTERGPDITAPKPFTFDQGLPSPFAFDAYKPTTAADVFADPSYDFRFNEGNRSVMANRISQGLAKTGGTLKALDRYGQNFGSQEFGNVDTRRSRQYTSDYLQARDAYDLNVVNPNTTAYNRAQDAYTLNVVNPNTTAYNRAQTDYLNRERIYYKNQQNAFDRPYQTASLGLRANE